MRKLYNFLFLFVIVNVSCTLAYSSNKAEENIIIKTTVASPSGQITGNATVCQNAAVAPLIKFEVIDDNGKEPYKFTYTINGGSPITIQTQNSDKSITVAAPTNVTNTYILTNVTDKDNNTIAISSATTVVITVIPNFTVSAGNDILVCKGNTISLIATPSGNGSNTVSYSWSGPNGFTSNQQSPSILNSTSAMSGNYTVTANIGSCLIQDVVRVDVAEPQITSPQFSGTQLVVCLTSSSITGDIGFNLTIPSYSSSILNYSIDWDNNGTIVDMYISSNWSNMIIHSFPIGTSTFSITMNLAIGCSIKKLYSVFVGSSPSPATLALFVNQGTGCVPHLTQYTFNVPSTNIAGTKYVVSWGDNTPDETYTQPVSITTLTHTYNISSCGHNVVLNNVTYYNVFQPTVITQNPCSPTPQPSGSGLISVGEDPKAVFTPNNNVSSINICTGQSFQPNNTSNFGFTIPTGSGATCLNTSPFYWTISPSTLGAWTATGLGTSNNTSNQTLWTTGSMTPSIIFNVPGTYTITLRVKNSCGDSSFSQTFCVQSKVTPVFTLSTPIVGCKPLVVTANSNSIDTSVSCSPVTYLWNIKYTSIYCGTSSSVTYLSSTSATSPNPTFQFNNAGTYEISLTTTNECGSLTSLPQTVTVKQPPTVTINTISNFCQNVNLNPIANINICSPNAVGTTYLWIFNGGTPASATTAMPPEVSYALPGNYSVSLAVTNECGTTTANSNTFSVQVAPIVQNETTVFCSGTSFTIVPSNTTSGNAIPVGTTYSWNTPIVTGGMSGGVLGTNQTSISGTLINTSTTAQTATYTIIPKIGSCSGNSFTLIVTVNPAPTISGTLNVCVGLTTTLSGSATPATTNPWVSSNTVISTVSNAGVVNGIAAGTATITYTNSNGCQKTATITVNALPTVTVNSPVVCSGLSATITATPGAVATYSYVWTVPLGFTNPGNIASFPTTVAGNYSVIITNTGTGCVSSSASGTVTANALPNLVITNPSSVCSPSTVDLTNSSITVGSDLGLTFSYWTNNTATIPLSNPSAISASGTYYIKGENIKGCTLIKPVVVIVNITPAITAIPNIVKCSNQPSGTITFTSNVAGTLHTWTNDTPSIGLATSGTGNIASFTTVNTGTTPVIATVIVTPSANGCTGANQVFTITVNPTPTVNQPTNQAVCNGLQTDVIPFAGNIPTSIYSWTNDKPTIGLAANGTGAIASFTAINATSAPIIATITVTPSLNGCSGIPKTVTITVNPSPTITFSPSPQTICSGGNTALVTLNSTTTGVTFGWTTTQPAGITEIIQTSGTTSIPVQTLTNTTNTDITIVYNATATVAGGAACLGALYTYTITVKPKPSVATPLAQTICSNSAFSITPLDGSGNTIPAGTIYTWSAAVISPVGAITGAIAQNTPQTSISQMLINGIDQMATATYLVTPKSGTCSGTPFTVVITVNPSPKVVFSGVNQKICSGSDSTAINLSNPTTGSVTFDWTASIPLGITGATASGTTAVIPVQNLINSTTNPLTVVYTAKATLTNGIVCQGLPYAYSITVNPAIVTSSILSNFNGFNVSTVGASDGAINVTLTGGSGVYSYLWSGPSGFSAISQDISNVPAGAYTLTINDGLCNPVILPFILLAPMPMLIQEDVSAHKDIFCNGYLTGEIKVDVSQQSIGPYDYELTLQGIGIVKSSLNDTAINYTFSGLKAGIYDLKVTDANGSLKSILGIIITQPSGITASISGQTNVLCFGDNTGTAIVTANGGSGILTYSWNTIPVQTSVTATGLTAGTYTVTITDANTCSTTKQVIITEPTFLSTTISAQTNVLCFGNNTGAATIAASGGKTPYTFSWDTSPIITSATATGLAAGTYNVTVTDANSCTKVQQVIITQPLATLSSSISNSNNVSCFGGSNRSATVSVTNGTLPYTYSWNTTPIQTLATATGLAIGNYMVTVTDFNGCTTTSPITISQPPAISTSISAQINVACSGTNTGSATIAPNGGTSPYTYSWDTTPIQTTSTGINLAMGTYNVTVTDANACSTIQQVIITEPNGIVTTITSQINVDCFEKSTGSATISVTGGTAPLTYSWDTATVNTTLTATGLVAGTYHLTVTDTKGCQKIQEVIISEPSDILITTDLEKDITCFGNSNGAIQITITGGTPVYNYSWTKNGIHFSTLEDLSNLSPGIYEVTVSDANNCGPKTAMFTITEPPVLDLTFVSQTNILCFGYSTGTINVNVVGGTPSASGYNFAWIGPNGFVSTNQNLVAISAGTYNLTVTDNSGCTDTLRVILTEATKVFVSAVSTPIICYGSNDGSINLTISGGVSPYTVLWSNMGSGTFQDNLSAGDYLATITDANNCVTTINVNIPEPPIFTINPVTKNITCFGANNGSINLNIVGGIAPVKLTWSDSAFAGNVRNNLSPGSYTATIIDSKPCTITRTFIILEPQLLVLSANLTNAFDCDNANSGAINLLVSGGTPPFTYVWSNGTTTEDLNNIPAGNYLVTVTDARGCVKTAQYSINRPPPIKTGVITKTDFNCETKYVKQTFVANVSGGVPPYQLVWSSGTVSGTNNEMMNTNQNGTVILYATDAIGCKSNYSFNVDVPKLGTPSFYTNSYFYSTYGSYSINDPIQFTNTATGDYISVAWDFGDGTFSTELNPVHTFINPKEYVVTQTVTYPFGCIYVQKITLLVGKGYVLVVPTAFTPNNDTLNDTFRPVTKALKNVRLDVYDTWGSLIYSELGAILRGWDGKIKGINAENGNYFCKVKGETFYGTIVEENHPFVLIK